MKQVKSKEFQMEVLESKIPVLVDFSATWCGAGADVRRI